ncbi:D-3-phosphoglycerate dehydrogenase [Pseudorhizobium tarimense]|uniref:D-3-phosphoglycerate dehydrogenase n=1 Tax=Pseudorhizobium tarimense TaxID=1079109 RepID=A0ABV2HBJ6_9HYPH|nr:D-2-hydroxyacid dehydrogenase family protein [Pseudorhizobium tarimense]MCJ8520918.1 D-2-hydroxyacid dehydrogenase family protein [Pseudorhizobium tarimense]
MKIALMDDYLNVARGLVDWSPVERKASLDVVDRPFSDIETAAATLAEYDILCTLRERTPFPAELIRRLPKLRFLCVTGKRYDTVDLEAARAQGVIVSNTPVSGAGAGAVTELTWGLILSLARNIPFEDRHMRLGEWQHGVGTTLRHKRLGVVGLGGLGQDVARIGLAFGMDVVAWSPNLTDERAAQAGVRRLAKDELFSTSDIVSLHLALAPATQRVIDAQAISAMRPNAMLINTARAGLLDEEALIAALSERRIRGAALDVYGVEPLPPDHPLRFLDNVVLTPHLGYFTREMLTAYYEFAQENILAFLDGAPIRVVS